MGFPQIILMILSSYRGSCRTIRFLLVVSSIECNSVTSKAEHLRLMAFWSPSFAAVDSSIPAPPANCKLQNNQISGSSLEALISLFLSIFQSKGIDMKLG